MPKSVSRAYSRYSQEAVSLLGNLIRCARIEQRISVNNAAQRAGVSKGTVERIEKGHPKCEVGVVFELAAIFGIKLFNAEKSRLQELNSNVQEKLTLLPKSARKLKKPLDDDF